MNAVRKDLCRLNKIGDEKLKELSEYDGKPLVGYCYEVLENYLLGAIDSKVGTRRVLGIGKIVSFGGEGGSVCVEIPSVSQSDLRLLERDNLYELAPELFAAITNGVSEIFVDDDGVAYIEGEETNEVFVLVGEYKKYRGKSFSRGKDVNGVFTTEDDARKMGDMLKDYGRLNDIEYTDDTIQNFLVM